MQPAFVGLNVGDVARPNLVQRSGCQVPTQQIVGNRDAVLAVGGDNKSAFAANLEAMLFLEFPHALFANAYASAIQLFGHAGQQYSGRTSAGIARICVNTIALLMRLPASGLLGLTPNTLQAIEIGD